MATLTRRNLLTGSAAMMAATPLRIAAAGLRGLKIGVTDWNLQQTGKLEAIPLARSIGFSGVEVSLGRTPIHDKLPLDNPETIAQYISAFEKHDLRPAGTCLDILHVNYLKNDPLGQKWVSDGIRVTKSLGAKVMLLPFFGKGALGTQAEKDYTGDVLRELGPEAERSGIVLGIENTISAADNVRIMDRARSEAVLVYYDIGNSHNQGFEVVREIEWLGSKRICQMHFKDNPNYLGEGEIDFPAVLRAVSRIGFKGFANLETASPSKTVEMDMKRNLTYVRKTILEIGRS
jgi:sugar phosphate isomerase/epimerase